MELPVKLRLVELVAKYKLEPSLRDLYVEGKGEVCLLTWFFKKTTRKNICIFPIDTVEIPPEELAKYKLNQDSNQQNVICLSETLCLNLAGQSINVKCLVDADFDRHLDRVRKNSILEYTDYTSLEMYYFNKNVMTKFFENVAGNFQTSLDKFLSIIAEILQQLYLIRLTNEKLGWGMRLLDLGNYIKFQNKTISFNDSDYIRNSLMKNKRLNEETLFRDVFKKMEAQLHPDPRHNIRGHDFSFLLFEYFKHYGGRRTGFKDNTALGAVLCGCMELEFIQDEPLFKKLRLM